ncbi:MAG: Fe-S cluster assembly protein HesB [Acidobacteria bacterium]|nr:Fe-S cluster assembly protein HesB [Acidobacteriota bacterium]
MSNTISIPTPNNFNFRRAVTGHGWYDLPPFVYDEAANKLSYVFYSTLTRKPEPVTLGEGGNSNLHISVSKTADPDEVKRVVRHILRIDEDLADFYSTVAGHDAFCWVEALNAGRLLRSGTVFEDLVKTLCTTNCSWGLTKIMTANLVAKLGKKVSGGGRAFPSAKSMASKPESFFREEIRAGYRSPYFLELGEAVAAGKLDPEGWLHSELPTDELKKEIKKVKGIGDYAAENLLKLLGRYDGLALDSWLRGGFYKKHNREKACPDKKIEKHYKRFGKWKGLAIWCDMTQSWFEEGR